MNGLEIWDRVEATDPAMTKSANIGGQMRTTVDAQYKKKMITKEFGPYGLGWGVEPNSEVYERIQHADNTLLVYRAVCFYNINDVRATFPIAAAIKEVYVTKNGSGYLKIDDEAIKKVRTDALTKGFTDLGFNSDIHMGMFDDDNYRQSQNVKSHIEKENHTEEVLQKEKENFSMWINKEIDSAKSLLPDNFKAFNRVMQLTRQKVPIRAQVARINSDAAIARIDKIIDEAKKENGNAD